jgi:catechol 2,3-dioxygenase-like lactoylglutathione lyase family enzyme
MNSRRIVIDHLEITVSDLAASRAFYKQALAPLGFLILREGQGKVIFGAPGADDFAINAGAPASRGVHIAFASESKAAVDLFHSQALATGAKDNGAPGYRPKYHVGYYAAFVVDPDGNNVEAVLHERAA